MAFRRRDRSDAASITQLPTSDRPTGAAATDLDHLLALHLDPALSALRFTREGNRRWVRDTKAPIRELVTIKALKGHQFVATWGISLDFVPHVHGSNQIRWHRTSASAVEDLGVDPMDWPDESQASRFILRLSGPGALEAAVLSLVQAAATAAAEWFSRVSDPESLVMLFEEADAAPTRRFRFDNYVQYRLAYAFVLASIGQRDEAHEQFARWTTCHGSNLTDHVKDRLHRALDEA